MVSVWEFLGVPDDRRRVISTGDTKTWTSTRIRSGERSRLSVDMAPALSRIGMEQGTHVSANVFLWILRTSDAAYAELGMPATCGRRGGPHAHGVSFRSPGCLCVSFNRGELPKDDWVMIDHRRTTPFTSAGRSGPGPPRGRTSCWNGRFMSEAAHRLRRFLALSSPPTPRRNLTKAASRRRVADDLGLKLLNGVGSSCCGNCSTNRPDAAAPDSRLRPRRDRRCRGGVPLCRSWRGDSWTTTVRS